MSKINHRRKNRPAVDRRYATSEYKNGFARQDGKQRDCHGDPIERDDENHNGRVGKTGFLDKSMHGWGEVGSLSGKSVGASIGNDFTNGHRGMAKAVRGAKKFVRTRIRFHENAATQKLVDSHFANEDDPEDLE